jgi:hypothetical protein
VPGKLFFKFSVAKTINMEISPATLPNGQLAPLEVVSRLVIN